MTAPRIVVFAYSDVGHACLDLLIKRHCDVATVFTHQDNPRENQWFPSVARLAQEHSIPVEMPEKITRASHEQLLRDVLRPDLIFSFYYRNMLPVWALELAPLGAFNLHGSYLPKYRGRAPVNWAVLHGESKTGATLHHMVKAPDAGDIVDQEKVRIGPDDTASDVMRRVRDAGVAVLGRQLDKLLAGQAPRIAQDESQATYFGGRRPEDGRIDWTKPARTIHNLVRAVTHPYPGAFCDELKPGCRTFLWKTRVHDDANGQPGEILSRNPLIIAAGEGAIEAHETTQEPL